MESKPTREESERAAAAWLLRRADSQWSDAEQAELDRWLAAAPGHRVSFARLESIWADTDRLRSIASGFAKGEVPRRGAIEQSPFFTMKQAEARSAVDRMKPWVGRGLRLRRSAWVATASLVLGLAAVLSFRASETLRGVTYSTSIGGFSTVPTEDGSVVTLNTNSQIEVRFTDRERRIELKRGEAFFDVAADPGRPFAVYANHQRVLALGTKFSVRMESEAVHVAVTEGKVSLEEAGSTFWPVRIATRATVPRILSPGSVADIAERHASVEQKPMSKIEQSLSWRTGYIALDGTPLSEAVVEFNRYNTRQLLIGDTSLATITVEGNFRSNNLDGFVRLLEEGFGITAAPVRNDRIVLRKR